MLGMIYEWVCNMNEKISLIGESWWCVYVSMKWLSFVDAFVDWLKWACIDNDDAFHEQMKWVWLIEVILRWCFDCSYVVSFTWMVWGLDKRRFVEWDFEADMLWYSEEWYFDVELD